MELLAASELDNPGSEAFETGFIGSGLSERNANYFGRWVMGIAIIVGRENGREWEVS